jgi:Family of unknown function (DUF5760)
MYSAGRTNIDESTRQQLLDNYLRNQQTQSTFNISSGTSGRNNDVQFHPSQFQSPLAHNDARSETFSDISRRSQVQPNTNSLVQVPNETSMTIVPVNELPDNISIDDFTNLVQKWIELDNWIKKSQEIAKQKRKSKDKLGEVITHYMTKFNIEDLNTSEGKIRCKVRYVKSGVNQKVVKEKIAELLKDNEETCNTLITKIFEEREKVEKVSLRRIKIT